MNMKKALALAAFSGRINAEAAKADIDPPLDNDAPKVVKAEEIQNREAIYSSDLEILLSDGNLYRYSEGKYTHEETEVADVEIVPLFGSEYSRSYDRLVLYKNGYLTFNDNIVYDFSGEAYDVNMDLKINIADINIMKYSILYS